MTEQATALDMALKAMTQAPEDDGARLRFYERLVDSELYLLLEREAAGDSMDPQVFPLEDGQVVLVFDTDARLGAFIGGPAHYAALSGRQLVRLLAGQGMGLGVNFGVSGAEIALPASAIDWVVRTLDNRPDQTEERPEEVTSPGDVPEHLFQGLDTKLASAVGLARFAYLAGVTYAGGKRTHLLAFIDPVAGAEDALAVAAGEALTFSGLEAGSLDVTFLAAADPLSARLAKVGLRFELPVPEKTGVAEIKAPGMDPNEPPILR
jgi:hypothetical protein